MKRTFLKSGFVVTIRYESMDSRNKSMFLWISYTILASLHISHPDFSIDLDFSSFSYSKCLHNVKISWQISIRLDNLDDLNKNLDKKKSVLISLDLKNLNWDKKKFALTVEKISTGFNSLFRQIEKSESWSQLVSTVQTLRLISRPSMFSISFYLRLLIFSSWFLNLLRLSVIFILKMSS
jgi:hypothetical protein